MNAALPLSGPSRQQIEAAVAAARRRAAASGRRVLLRLHAELAPGDPWGLLQHPLVAGPWSAWHDGTTGMSIAAAGSICTRQPERAGRFVAARRFCARLTGRLLEMGLDGASVEAGAPLCFVGLTFAAEATAMGEPWQAWRGGLLRVAPQLVYRPGADQPCRAVLAAAVAADSPIAPVAARLWERLVSSRQAVAHGFAAEAAPLPASPMAEAAPDGTGWHVLAGAARAAAAGPALRKLVLARRDDWDAPAGQHFDPAATLAALRRRHHAGLCFAMQHHGTTFLGAPPELLVEVAGRALRTQAVAGTAPRGASAAADARLGRALLASAKDRSEHAMVADALASALAPLCVALRHARRPRLARLPDLQHLETPFVGTLRRPGGVLDLVEHLHPTPAVGGWPRAAAAAWLREHEHLDRGLYAGPVGYVTATGDGTFAVALRSALLSGGAARAFAGAGIVAASDPAAEWQETCLKLGTVRAALRTCAAA